MSEPEAFELPPYAAAMGMAVERFEGGAPVLAFDFAERVLGRPGYLHGGALGGLLEMAAIGALRAEISRRGSGSRVKPVNVTVEFLRGGTAQRTFAIGRVVRAGRRVAHVTAEAWQDDPGKPIATALMNVLLTERAA
ncbi:MAG TPA: PaaI family thioesterase [Novosphingobium sp.]|nr:PaaI family thioesterase [Novosphingobium sp.]